MNDDVGMNSIRHRRRTRVVVVGVCLAVLTSLIGALPPAAAVEPTQPGRQPGPKAQLAQEVRTVWTDEFGVARPEGLAYDTARREFLVAQTGASGTSVVRLGADEQDLGLLTLPSLSEPATLAFDPVREELTAIDGSEQVRVPSDALAERRPRTERTSIEELQLEAPASTTFDPDDGAWFVLEDGSDDVAIVSDLERPSKLEALELPPSAAPRLIAFNASDGLLYVMDLGHGQLDAVDRKGRVRRSIGLAATELSAPVAMVFAPSTDPTDEPGDLNLYVADAGGAATLGGVTELSLTAVTAPAAPVDTATLIRTTATSSWTPGAPDPSGVVWTRPVDELVVVDSEVEEVTGAGWHDVNLWQATRTGSVVGVGTLWGPKSAGSYSKEPTGLGFDAATGTLFVADDTARKVFAVKRGPDGAFGTSDDIVSSLNAAAYGSTDTEDPEFDPQSRHLFFLDGVGMEVYRVDPVDGVFGNGDDTMTQFDISHLGPVDFEGLASNPDRRTLYVGARSTKQIFEITHDGTLLRTISASAISGLKYISGLAVAPASDGSNHMNLWIADRAVDNGGNPNENDGKLFEITAPDIGVVPVNGVPVAADDAVVTTVGVATTISVLANDSDPDGDPLTVTELTQPANGSVVQTPSQTVTYTPNAGYTGPDTFTYRANDGQADSNVATVTVTVNDDPPPRPAAPAFRSAASASNTTAKGTSLTIARPAGVQAGDLLLAQVRHRGTKGLTAPAGWTLIAAVSRAAAHHNVYYRVAGGSEAASYAFNQGDDSGMMAGGIGAYTDVDPSSPINAWAASASETTALVAPTATSTVANTRVVRLWGWRGVSATNAGVGFNAPPTGVAQRWSEQVGKTASTRNRVLAGDHVQAVAGPVGTSTAGGSTSTQENRRNAFTIILAPPAAG